MKGKGDWSCAAVDELRELRIARAQQQQQQQQQQKQQQQDKRLPTTDAVVDMVMRARRAGHHVVQQPKISQQTI
jgi:hypothetical protein